MNESGFNKNILAILKEWAYLGETVNEKGTKLIGHNPQLAPKAYINIIYRPISSTDSMEFETQSEKVIPQQYKEFLTIANGLNIFSGAMRVMGYVPVTRDANGGPHEYPPNVMASNQPDSIKGLQNEYFIVGWYKIDGSYVALDGTGKAIRFDAQGDGKCIEEWPDFDTWIFSEVSRLSELFKANKNTTFNK